jgi:hypothetical protein
MARRRYFPDQAQEELEQAVRADEIGNATEFAREFALRYGLNPETVRSTISRLRREMGLVGNRRYRVGMYAEPPVSGAPPAIRPAGRHLTAFDLLLADPADPTIARLGAAMVFRYERDPEFRRAVDAQRAAVERQYEVTNETRELPPEEREALSRLLQRRPDPAG